MTSDKPLRSQSLDETLDNITAIAAVGSREQILAPMTVASRAAIEVGDGLKDATSEIKSFNDSTTKLTNELIALNRRLLWATWVIAVAAVLAGALAVVNIYDAFTR